MTPWDSVRARVKPSSRRFDSRHHHHSCERLRCGFTEQFACGARVCGTRTCRYRFALPRELRRDSVRVRVVGGHSTSPAEVAAALVPVSREETMFDALCFGRKPRRFGITHRKPLNGTCGHRRWKLMASLALGMVTDNVCATRRCCNGRTNTATYTAPAIATVLIAWRAATSNRSTAAVPKRDPLAQAPVAAVTLCQNQLRHGWPQ